MAPNKFEQQLKDTLEGRTIAPSQKAWSQLDNALKTSQSKTKRSFWWLGIAASFLGVCLVVYITKNNSSQTQSVVNKANQEVKTPNNLNEINNSPIVESQVEPQKEEAHIVEEKTQIANNKKISKNVIETTPPKNQTQNLPKEVVITPLNTKLNNTVVADQKATTKEATLLLEEAYSQIKSNNNQYQVEKIDANALLEEVEIKSEKSLKNRLFHAVKSGYETLKSTVAERNY